MVREMQEPGSKVFAAITRAFGKDIVGADGRLVSIPPSFASSSGPALRS
jgi:dephospho-CoA kinase